MELMATPKTNEFLCDGVKLKVRSLDSLMSIEPGGIEVDGEITNKLTQEDYYSMLCNNLGFDAYNEEYVDMVEAGILDPAKVTRSALQNATSVASTFLTTESCVASIKEPEPAMPAGAGMNPGMM